MALILRLNGNNYVSEKTKTAFEAALQDGRRVKGNGKGEETGALQAGGGQEARGSGEGGRDARDPRGRQAVPAPPVARPTPDYNRLLEVVERGLAQSFDHQSLTLRVHEQYLSQQSDYAQIFSQLMEQQGEIFANGNANPQQADVARQVLEGLSRSMARFHEIQAETLGVHKQFLSQQAEYSWTTIELLRQQHEMPANGGDGGSPVTVTFAAVEPVKPVVVEPAAGPVVPATVPVIELPVVAPEPVAVSASVAGLGAGADGTSAIPGLTQSLLEVVSEKTGYPAEMLELSMDMEADLGIDSIKRVEILGALQDLYPELPEFSTEALAELRTLGQIVEYMGAQVAGEGADGTSAIPGAAGETPAIQGEDGKKKGLAEAPHGIRRREVRLRPLPAPDFLEFVPPHGHVCLVADDGTPAGPRLAQALAARGWEVVLLRLPASLNPDPQPAPEGVRQVALDDLSEVHVRARLDALGPVWCTIFVNPPAQDAEGYFSDTAKARLKTAFLVAGHLKDTLTAAAREGRACFVTVTRMDGTLGVEAAADFVAVDGGFGGLVKTLHLEWPDVHCRAVDVSPNFDAEQVARAVLAELHDPNRLLTEVGYGERGRVTLEAGR